MPHNAEAHTDRADPTERILTLCRDEGFALAGITPIEPSPHADELRAWLAAGKHGTMHWLADTLTERLDPTHLLPGAQSAVMVADFYAPRGTGPGTPGSDAATDTGRIARYARGRDYHAVIKRRLHRVCDALRCELPGTHTRAFCDTAPVLERELAHAAGLGWIGKHTLLIHPTHGSWMVLGGFLTTLKLTAPSPRTPDHCGTCTRCIDACPTDAITPYSVDARRCISYLTIEHETPIDPALADKLNGWFVGCDICQEVCPHNSPRRSEFAESLAAPHPDLAPTRDGFDLLTVLGWDEPTRRARFASSAMKRITLAQAKRNAILLALDAIAHAPDDTTAPARRAADLRDRLTQLAWDPQEPQLVRDTARDALRQLAKASP